MVPPHCHHRLDVATATDIEAARRLAMTLAGDRLHDADRDRLDAVVSALSERASQLPDGATLLMREWRRAGVECISLDRHPPPNAPQDDSGADALATVDAQADLFASHVTPGIGSAHLARVWRAGGGNAPNPRAAVDVGAVMVARSGADSCGDGWFFRCDNAEHGVALVVDGLPGADAIARRTEAVVAATTPGLSPQMVVGAIRRDVADARTGTVAVLRISDEAVDYTALGAVAGAVIRDRKVTSLAARWTMVGYNPQIPACVHLVWAAGDHVILHSDGCARLPILFIEHGLHKVEPTLAAAVLLRDGAAQDDDQTILILRNIANPVDQTDMISARGLV
ncbi:hypothetical protein [Azospirillum sp.]|uniref:hypothetical protein n=1 Tax=Azospirillum sp. TaxID=34012 RepID=UPI00262A53BB|nr:hypothetical protein [Azospirillum sp.]